jgi:hypothetical protein
MSNSTSFLLTSTPNSAQISEAVSKSNDELIHVMILFSISFFIISTRETHIFSENSFTVILSSINNSDFLTKLADVVASRCSVEAWITDTALSLTCFSLL